MEYWSVRRRQVKADAYINLRSPNHHGHGSNCRSPSISSDTAPCCLPVSPFSSIPKFLSIDVCIQNEGFASSYIYKLFFANYCTHLTATQVQSTGKSRFTIYIHWENWIYSYCYISTLFISSNLSLFEFLQISYDATNTSFQSFCFTFCWITQLFLYIFCIYLILVSFPWDPDSLHTAEVYFVNSIL